MSLKSNYEYIRDWVKTLFLSKIEGAELQRRLSDVNDRVDTIENNSIDYDYVLRLDSDVSEGKAMEFRKKLGLYRYDDKLTVNNTDVCDPSYSFTVDGTVYELKFIGSPNIELDESVVTMDGQDPVVVYSNDWNFENDVCSYGELNSPPSIFIVNEDDAEIDGTTVYYAGIYFATSTMDDNTKIPVSFTANNVDPEYTYVSTEYLPISTNVIIDKTSDDKVSTPKSVYGAIYPNVISATANQAIVPNVVYDYGLLPSTISFNMETPEDGSINNHYYFMFDTDTDTAPTITWPSAITQWANDEAPEIKTGKHYEISVINGYAAYMEFTSND